MKRVNIQRDIDSRQKIAFKESLTIVEPIKTKTSDAKSEEIQGCETNEITSDIIPTTKKRGRKTKEHVQEI